MIASRLISKKNELEAQLKRGIRDPQKRAYCTQRLIQLDNEIRAMGFSTEEIAKNSFNYTGPGKTLEIESGDDSNAFNVAAIHKRRRKKSEPERQSDQPADSSD